MMFWYLVISGFSCVWETYWMWTKNWQSIHASAWDCLDLRAKSGHGWYTAQSTIQFGALSESEHLIHIHCILVTVVDVFKQVQQTLYVTITLCRWHPLMSCIRKHLDSYPPPKKSHRNPTNKYSTIFNRNHSEPPWIAKMSCSMMFHGRDSQDATETLEKANERHREVTAMVKAPGPLCGCALCWNEVANPYGPKKICAFVWSILLHFGSNLTWKPTKWQLAGRKKSSRPAVLVFQLHFSIDKFFVQIPDEIPNKTLVLHPAKFIFRRIHIIMIIWPGDFRYLMSMWILTDLQVDSSICIRIYIYIYYITYVYITYIVTCYNPVHPIITEQSHG